MEGGGARRKDPERRLLRDLVTPRRRQKEGPARREEPSESPRGGAGGHVTDGRRDTAERRKQAGGGWVWFERPPLCTPRVVSALRLPGDPRGSLCGRPQSSDPVSQGAAGARVGEGPTWEPWSCGSPRKGRKAGGQGSPPSWAEHLQKPASGIAGDRPGVCLQVAHTSHLVMTSRENQP